MRFVHAIPDLPALDMYWNQPDGHPNATILYGAENPYLDLTNADSLKITEAGRPDHVVFSIQQKPTPIKGLVVTSIVRGESKPYGTHRTVSVFVLSDNSNIGNFILSFQTFGIRLVNATRSLQMSILIKAPTEVKPRGNYPSQTIVEYLEPDSVSTYLGLTPNIDSIARFWFVTQLDPFVDSLISFNAPFILRQDQRYTFIAVENIPVGGKGRSVDTLILRDSMSTLPGMAKVRLIHLSPDHTQIKITGSFSTTVKKKDVQFFDVAPGTVTLTLSDGSSTKTISFMAFPRGPMSLYLLPATNNDPFPFQISYDGLYPRFFRFGIIAPINSANIFTSISASIQ